MHEINSRARKFEETAKQRFEAERRKAEKDRILKERARARREAHEAAVAELRRRQEEEAEQVPDMSTQQWVVKLLRFAGQRSSNRPHACRLSSNVKQTLNITVEYLFRRH